MAVDRHGLQRRCLTVCARDVELCSRFHKQTGNLAVSPARHDIDGPNAGRVATIRIGTILKKKPYDGETIIAGDVRHSRHPLSHIGTAVNQQFGEWQAPSHHREVNRRGGTVRSARVHIRSMIQQKRNQVGAILV